MSATHINGQPWVNQYQFNAVGNGPLSWSAGTSLPVVLSESHVVVTNGWAYLLGGNSSVTIDTVYAAPIDGAGVLGSWAESGRLPYAVALGQAILTSSRLYLIGGANSGGSLNTVVSAPVAADGTLGSWVIEAQTIPGPLSRSAAVVTRDRVYLLGGHNGSASSSAVYTAPIDGNGVLGAWTTAASLPGGMYDSVAVTTDRRVYLIYDYYSANVYTATYGDDGVLGAWSVARSDSSWSLSSVFCTANGIWMVGGRRTSTWYYTTRKLGLDASGSISWYGSDSNYPIKVGCKATLITSSRIYMLGGVGSSRVANVYWAPLSGGANNYLPLVAEAAAEPVDAVLDQRWGLFIGSVMANLDAVYQLTTPIEESVLLQSLGLVMETSLRQPYGNAAVQLAGLVALYGNAAAVLRALDQRWASALEVLTALDQRYTLLHLRLAALEQLWAVCLKTPLAVLEARYDLRSRDQLTAALVEHYNLVPSTTITGLAFAVRCGGVDITRHLLSCSWTMDETSYLIEATVVIGDQASYRTLAAGDALEIDWQGQTVQLFVANKRRSARGVSGDQGSAGYSVDYTLTARSLSVGLDEPYALPLTREWTTPVLASTLAAELIADLDDVVHLDWQCDDWIQPGGTFFITDETPLSGLRKLAAIIGALVTTAPDNTLVVRMPDQVPPAGWDDAVPAAVLSDAGGLFSDGEEETASALYNCVTVTNQQESDSGTRFESEAQSDARYLIKGYRVPWQDIGLATSGGDWVTIEDMGVVTEQISEQVEFIDGSATATKPIYSAVAVSWLQGQLGAVTAAEDGSLRAEISGCSLATITYTTKYHAWICGDSRDESVQFYEVPLL